MFKHKPFVRREFVVILAEFKGIFKLNIFGSLIFGFMTKALHFSNPQTCLIKKFDRTGDMSASSVSLRAFSLFLNDVHNACNISLK